MKNAISEMKNTLEGINSRLDEGKDQINLKDKVAENTQSEQQKENNLNEDSLRELWDNMKSNNTCITGIPEREERTE